MLDNFAPLLVSVLVGYSAADLTILSFRDSFLPAKTPTAAGPLKPMGPGQTAEPKSALQNIVTRNIFSVDGTIPEPLSAKGTKDKPGQEMAPVLSQLPITLKGTVVHSDPAKSIAEIEMKSKSASLAVRVGNDIPGLATLIRVERNKIIIRNLSTSALEYIDGKVAEKKTVNAGFSTGVSPISKAPGEVKMIAPNKFKLSRATITKHTQDLGKLVMQASTVPRKKPNGEIDCYILTAFQPDSIFADLGVQQGDCIKTVNGESIDSPAKAMQLYQSLKSANQVKIVVESDGRDVEKEYSIE
jgi:general secretion pathway protein C